MQTGLEDLDRKGIFSVISKFKAMTFLLVMLALQGGCFSEPGDLSSHEREGYELYRMYCRQCHRLQSPKLHTAEEWPAVVDKMQRFMAERNKKVMDDQQKQKILAFLQGRSRK